VNNVAPTATISNNGPISAGGGVAVALTNPVDPSSVDTSAGFHCSFRAEQQRSGQHLRRCRHQRQHHLHVPSSGTYTVYGRISTKDNGFTDYTTTISVTPVVTSTLTLSKRNRRLAHQ